jgi:hypothetical protein
MCSNASTLAASRGPIAAAVDLLDLERVEEAFHGGVFAVIALPAHAAQEPMSLQERLGVLAAPIGMDHHAGFQPAPPE